MDIFSERFLPLIENSGKTDKELEKSMELPRSIIYDWKHGRNKSSFKKYASNFAKFFNVSTDYLLGNTDSPNIEDEDDLQRIIDVYRNLNNEGRKVLNDYAEFISTKVEYKKSPVSEQDVV